MSDSFPIPKTKTEAPTSGITESAAAQAAAQKKQAMLTEEEFDFVNLIHQHYSVHGVLFTADLGLQFYNMPVKQYQKLMKSAVVQKAIKERGISTEPEHVSDSSWRNLALTGQQILVADTMLDLLDNRSYKKKLQDLGVSTRQWSSWCKEPAFSKYLDENTESVLKNGQHEAALALMDEVSKGNIKAIQYYNEYTGRFVQRSNATLNNPQADSIDARRLIQQIVEIVIDEVDDHDTASRIADRMKTLMTSTHIAHSLTSNSATNSGAPVGLLQAPEVIANRELTPEMQRVGMDT